MYIYIDKVVYEKLMQISLSQMSSDFNALNHSLYNEEKLSLDIFIQLNWQPTIV